MMARCIKICLQALLKLLGLSPKEAEQRSHSPMFLALVSEAWISIGTNRMRAFLAMLGIIIGVGSVILMVAIGTGSQRKVEAAINSLGNNLLIISTIPSQQPGQRRNTKPTLFTPSDADAIAQLALVEEVSYSTIKFNMNISSKTGNKQFEVMAVDPGVLSIRNWVFDEGDTFSSEDIQRKNRVAIIGADVADRFFPEDSAIGKNILIGDKKTSFLIIGVLKPKGSAPDGKPQDDIVFIPITAFKAYVAPSEQNVISFLYAKATSTEMIEFAAEDIRAELRAIREIPDSMGDNFSLHNLNAIMKVASDASAAFAVLLGSIASISLIVGSIGIMNIMLVTVSERTREIGIRKAIGATERQILLQFLLEAVMIASVGSIIGLLISFFLGLAMEEMFAIPVVYNIWTVVMALAMACAIGIISGLYPARKAAKMQPIEALRTVGA